MAAAIATQWVPQEHLHAHLGAILSSHSTGLRRPETFITAHRRPTLSMIPIISQISMEQALYCIHCRLSSVQLLQVEECEYSMTSDMSTSGQQGLNVEWRDHDLLILAI